MEVYLPVALSFYLSNYLQARRISDTHYLSRERARAHPYPTAPVAEATAAATTAAPGALATIATGGSLKDKLKIPVNGCVAFPCSYSLLLLLLLMLLLDGNDVTM